MLTIYVYFSWKYIKIKEEKLEIYVFYILPFSLNIYLYNTNQIKL